MAYNGSFDEYKLNAVVNHEPYFVEHRFLDDRLPADLQRSGQVQRWVREKELGEGTYGIVWLESLQRGRNSGPTVRAVKTVQKAKMQDQRELIALSHFSTRKHLRSGYFVEFYGWFEDPKAVYITMEYFPHGTLNLFIDVKHRIPEKEIRMITGQLLLGLALIHEQNYAHRDLKPENIFIDTPGPEWSVKIGDFGISKNIKKTGTELRTRIGTPLYTAPEIQGDVISEDGENEEDEDKYTSKVDLWSLGCVVFEIAAHSVVFPGWPHDYKKCCRGRWFPTRPDGISEAGWGFIKSLLAPDPQKRSSAVEALRHDWITSSHFSDLSCATAETLLAAKDTKSSEVEKPITSDLPDRTIRAEKRIFPEKPYSDSHEPGADTKSNEIENLSRPNTPTNNADGKLIRTSISLVQNRESSRSPKATSEYLPKPQQEKDKEHSYFTGASNSENGMNSGSNRAENTLVGDRLKRVEKKTKTSMEVAQIASESMHSAGLTASKEPMAVNLALAKFAELAELASAYHSQRDYPQLEDVSQRMLEMCKIDAENYRPVLEDVWLGIAGVYEEQKKYDQAALVYEEYYSLQHKGTEIGSMVTTTATKNGFRSVYGKQNPNLMVTLNSVEGLPKRRYSALFLELEISHPILHKIIWRTKAIRQAQNPHWDKTIYAKVVRETECKFTLYDLHGSKWYEVGHGKMGLGNFGYGKAPFAVTLEIQLVETKGTILVTFSTRLDAANCTMTQADGFLSQKNLPPLF